MVIKFKRFSDTAKIPTRGTDFSAGYDLYADNESPIVINPHSTVMISSGIGVEIPEGYFGGIYARSGLSIKSGLRPANCTGVIDSDYRGAMSVAIHNDGMTPKHILPHERVAQLIIQKFEEVEFVEVDDLTETERGEGGFGHTGRT